MMFVPLTRFVSGFFRAPREVPLAIHRVGPFTLVSLPGEFTTLAGRRIANRVGDALGVPPADVVPIGLAGEYLSYFTTEGEYAAQHYEGGSTLYGWGAERVVEDALVALAGRDPVPRADAAAFAYEAGWRTRFGLGDAPGGDWRSDVATLLDADPGAAPLACWTDAGTEAAPASASDDVRPPRLVARAPDEHADDGADAAFVMLGRDRDESCWCAWWLASAPPPPGPHGIQRMRGDVIQAPAFTGGGAPCGE
jgi:hypothetical protein